MKHEQVNWGRQPDGDFEGNWLDGAAVPASPPLARVGYISLKGRSDGDAEVYTHKFSRGPRLIRGARRGALLAPVGRSPISFGLLVDATDTEGNLYWIAGAWVATCSTPQGRGQQHPFLLVSPHRGFDVGVEQIETPRGYAPHVTTHGIVD